MFSKTRFASFPLLSAWVTVAVLALLYTRTAYSQSSISLSDLSAFKPTGKTWAIGADAIADITKAGVLSVTQGTGVLANLPGTNGADLFTNAAYGDVDIELEYMMAKDAKSGMYVQGRYEILLCDSWSVKHPTSGDNGGIGQRWNDSKPEGQQGYEGYAPRQNVSKAPGLWQQLKLSFLAPRFDAGGKKTASAKFLRIELNGVMIHENVELSGPARGAINNDETTTAPLRFQGDQGPIAFRNIRVTSYDKPRPGFSNVSYRGDASAGNEQGPDPILVPATANTVLRSFMDIPGSRVVHAISVGSPDNIHYTYDPDKGAIVQVWRGGFLDATPMWYDRGDGSSRPLGAVLRFGKPAFTIAKLASPDGAWIPDSVADFTPKGYKIDKSGQPAFLYMKAGSMVEDAIRVLNNGEGFSREIIIQDPAGTYYARLAAAKSIESINGIYVIGDRSYYIRIDDAGSAKPVIRTINGLKELLVPVQSRLRYSIIF